MKRAFIFSVKTIRAIQVRQGHSFRTSNICCSVPKLLYYSIIIISQIKTLFHGVRHAVYVGHATGIDLSVQ